MGKAGVYIETSVISYLASRPSPDLLTAACQQVTSEWWETERSRFDLFISELVVLEARGGDSETAARRLAFLRGITELRITDSVKNLAGELLSKGAFPAKAQADALHIAMAAVHRIDFLLTWNCRHINNPATKPAIRSVCKPNGVCCPEICTPFEIRGMKHEEE